MSVKQKIIKNQITFIKSGLILAIEKLLGATKTYGRWSYKEAAK